MVRSVLSSSVRNCSHKCTLETGPDEPTQPMIVHRRAVPAAPTMTYYESVHIATSPEVKICSARSKARSSAVLLV